MANRIPVSFKDNELENKLWQHLQKQSQLIGASAYIKQLILEDMLRKEEKSSTEK